MGKWLCRDRRKLPPTAQSPVSSESSSVLGKERTSQNDGFGINADVLFRM